MGYPLRQALAQRGIAVVNLSTSLNGGRDADYWILPFDQHRNARANDVCVRRLTEALLAQGG